jgi:1-aminocyclopropane-1-carboxylate deaminase/D-cysteine desulfhydrase-like pyridoxal-dependent ACC family enzyme
MQPLSFESVTVDEFQFPEIKEKNTGVAVLRLDKLHPIISGNKWFKLKYYLEDAKATGKEHIITFGGAWSNHIIATAAAGKLSGFKTTGIIRGERLAKPSHTLQKAMEYGMELSFINRSDYRNKKLPAGINENNDRIYLIKEGGYGRNGTKGASEILNYCKKENYSHIVCAAGSTTMMAGLIKASLPNQEIIGISVLKNNRGLENELGNLLLPEEQKKKFRLIHDFHFGGYARYTHELINFMNAVYKNTAIPTDFVYTAKLFYGIVDMIKNNLLPAGSNVLLIHSGGLQGNISLPKGSLIF